MTTTVKYIRMVEESNKTKINLYAKILAKKYGKYGLTLKGAKQEIEDGICNIGELAEHFLADMFGAEKQKANNAGYDLVLPNGKTIECKTFSWWLGKNKTKTGKVVYTMQAVVGGKKANLNCKSGDIAFMYSLGKKSYISLVSDNYWRPLLTKAGSINMTPTNNSFTVIHSFSEELVIPSYR